MRVKAVVLLWLVCGAASAQGDASFSVEKARVEAWQAMLDSPTWQPTVVKRPGSKGTMTAPGFDCGMLGPSSSRLLLEFKPGRHSDRHGVLRYRGDGAKHCLPSGVGVIEYSDGSRWIGEVGNKGNPIVINMLPFPSGVGQLSRADGSRQIGRAVSGKDWSWKFETVVFEQPAGGPAPVVVQAAALASAQPGVSNASSPGGDAASVTPPASSPDGGAASVSSSASSPGGSAAPVSSSVSGPETVAGQVPVPAPVSNEAGAGDRSPASGAPSGRVGAEPIAANASAAGTAAAVAPAPKPAPAARDSFEFAMQNMQGIWEYPAIGLSFRVEGDKAYVIKRAEGRRYHDDGMLAVYDLKFIRMTNRSGGITYGGYARCRYYEGDEIIDVDCDAMFHYGGRQTFSTGMMQAHRPGPP